MTEGPFDMEAFTALVRRSAEIGREFYSDPEAPGGNLPPTLLAFVIDSPDSFHGEVCVIPHEGVELRQALAVAGTLFGQAGKMVPGVVLTAEAWASVRPVGYRGNLRPANDLHRREVLTVMGMTADKQAVGFEAQIWRGPGGVTTSELVQLPAIDGTHTSLMHFWLGYAPAFLASAYGREGLQ